LAQRGFAALAGDVGGGQTRISVKLDGAIGAQYGSHHETR